MEEETSTAGIKRNRRSSRQEEEQEVEEEERMRQAEEMDKFYALLENIKAIRDSLRSKANKRMKPAVDDAEPAWKPQFELEDFFAGDAAVGRAVRKPSKEERRNSWKEPEEEVEDDKSSWGLNLFLSN
ncbi:hypothetical protein Cni_G07370 [Canna indica]|uniref:Uncharacterized protein n=1 Tax=Canna indica TaxID=4628 RepID=A0AAQ3JYM3_9LILI|nr:hypothetical protein Cni_G07370 [Canna indica]